MRMKEVVDYISVLALASVFWNYFYLTNIEATVKGKSAKVRLKRHYLFYPDVMRTCICVTPLLALLERKDINNNLFVSWLALVTSISPLFVPSEEPAWEDGIRMFFIRWLVSELDTIVKTAAVVFIFSYLFKVFGFNHENQISWLRKWFSISTRISGCLELPAIFYFLAFIILIVKVWALAGVKEISGGRVLSALVCGIIVMLYFYNLTGKIRLDEHRFDLLFSGVLAGWIVKFLIALTWARLDFVEERRERRFLRK
jgi:hypothetical protein